MSDLSSLIADQWQPIETAPKDGKEIILYSVPNEAVSASAMEQARAVLATLTVTSGDQS